jgi:hypothetical protein
MASFDVKRVTPLEWAGIGAGALAFIVSFFPWYSVDFGDTGLPGFDLDTSFSAWDSGFLAWFSMLLLLAVAVLILLPHFGTQVPNLPMLWLGLAGVSLLFVIIRWLTFDSATGLGGSAGPGFGLFIGLILALASAAAGFMVFRGSSRTVST